MWNISFIIPGDHNLIYVAASCDKIYVNLFWNVSENTMAAYVLEILPLVIEAKNSKV